MSPNEVSSDFDGKLFDFSSSGGSDLESFLEEDKTSNENHINKQWEAIERTLYQESGQQVTDPELLRECKLWRETFPHFRVKGTKIQAEKQGENDKETEKSIQTQSSHLNLNKVNERRENIKTKVVGELVERLIAKFNLIKESSPYPPEPDGNDSATPETLESSAGTQSTPKRNKNAKAAERKTSASSTEKESYFERGKLFRVEVDSEVTVEEMEESLARIFEDRDDPSTSKSQQISRKNCKSSTMPNSCKSEYFGYKPEEKAEKGVKPARFCAPLDSLSNVVKPFEMTNKIDKKYGGLLDKIMKKRSDDLQPIRNCRTTSCGEDKSYRDSLEKLRIGSGLDEFSNRNKNLPRINKFSNYWMERGEANSSPMETGFHFHKTNNARTKSKPSGEVNIYEGNVARNDIDVKFMEALRKEMLMSYKRSPKKSGIIEEISLRRPNPLRSDLVERTQKSLNYGNVVAKRNKKISRTRQSKNSLEGDANPRGRAKSTNLSNAKASSGTKNGILPPIESDEDESQCESEANLTEFVKNFKSTWPVEEWKKFGLFDDDYLLKINVYWMKFPPPSPTSHYILGALYAVIMVVGIIGNLLIIVMFVRKRSLRTPSNIFVMNLAISDALLLLKMPLFIFNSLYLGPVLGNLGCSIYGFVGGLTGTVSIMTLAAIAFDRYQVIVHPLERKTRFRIYIQILLIWLYGAFFSTIPILDIGLNRYVPEGYLTSCSFDYLTKDLPSRLTIFVFFIAAWVVPLCIILGSYAAMYRVIFKAQRGHINSVTRHCKEMEIRRTELKVAIMVICVICLWTFSWTPYAVVALLGITGNEKYITPTSSMIPALFCKTASCIDPFVYAITNPRFRKELKRECRRTPRTQMSLKTERREFWTMADDAGDRGRQTHNESVDEVIVLATSIQHSF